MKKKIAVIIACALVIALIAFASGYLGVKLAGEAAANPTEKQAESPKPAPVQSVSPSFVPAPTAEPVSNQNFFPPPVPVTTPDPEYVNKLRKNAVDVNTDKEFADALETGHVIVLKKDIILGGESIYLSGISALIIDEGVTLTITSLNFYASCPIVNLGEIIVDGRGRMVFSNEPDYSCIGNISIKGSDAEIVFNSRKIGADEIAYFLREDSLFNWLAIVDGSSDEKLLEILIDHDITIPAGKTLWINIRCVLYVPEGVTLTNNGQIRYYNEPVVKGKINGTGQVYHD